VQKKQLFFSAGPSPQIPKSLSHSCIYYTIFQGKVVFYMYGFGCGYPGGFGCGGFGGGYGGGYGYGGGRSFALIVVLFILLIIIGASYVR